MRAGGRTVDAMRTLILGATSQLGRALLRVVPDAHGTYFRQSRTGDRWHAADLTVPADLDAVLDRVQPERVVLCAYVQSGPWLQELTAEAPGWIASACRPARFVHLSSDVVFPGLPEPVDEDAAPGPVHAYGSAKLESERRVLEACPDALVVRTSLLWAAEGTQARLAQEAPFPFYRDEIRCPTHLDDLATALLAASATDLSGVVHLAGADTTDRATFARALAAHLGADPTRIRDRLQPAGRPKHLHLISRRLPALPGWTTRVG